VADRKYFKEMQASKSFAAGEYSISRSTGRPVLSFATPLLNGEKEIAGAVVASLDVNWFHELLESADVQAGIRVDFMDHRGAILHSSLPRIRPAGFRDRFIEQQSSETPKKAFWSECEDGKCLVVWSGLTLGDSAVPYMFVRASTPQAFVYREVHGFTVVALVFLLLAGSVASAFVWLMGTRRILRPIRLLADTADRVAKGDFSARVTPCRAPLEVETMMAGFNVMVDAISQREIEQRHLLQAITEKEQNYSEIFDAANDCILLHDATGRIVDVNVRIADVFGYAPEAAKQLNIGNLCEDVPPFTQEQARSMIKKTLADGPQLFEWRARRASGEAFWAEVSMRSSNIIGRQCVLAAVRDITARKAAEDALAESEERYRLTTLMTGQLIYDYDFRTCRIRWDGAIQAITGHAAEEFGGVGIGQLTEMIHPEDRPIALALVEQATNTLTPYFAEYRFKRKDQSYVWVENNGSFIANGGGKPARMFGTIKDITERKKAEEDRLGHERQMLQVQKLESLGVMASGIAHDFNNLLMGVMGNTDLALVKMTEAEPAHQHLAEIKLAALRAADLCQQMLAYSGRGRFVVVAVNLNDLVEEMVRLLKTTLSKKASLAMHLNLNLPLLHGDPTQLRQVIMNLALNAAEAVGDQSGMVTLSSGVRECSEDDLKDAIQGRVLAPGPYVWFEVTDTGCGMDSNTLSRIFEPFFTTKFTGRGLGLAAVLGIVRGHKGALKIKSRVGEGSTFTVLLPVACEMPVQAPAAAEESAASAGGTILLVEDERMLREMGSQMLIQLGFKTLLAADGREALRVYRENTAKIDLVVLDLTMPNMNGEEALVELLKMNPDVRVVMTSGYTETDVAARFEGKGLSGYLQKPYTLDHLRVRLQEFMRSRTPER
jgi:PAS domain S-box-containing protein